MPSYRRTLLRYHIIDSCLNCHRHKFPTKEYIIEKIKVQSGTIISYSMFTIDINNMGEIYTAPIKYFRHEKGYGYTEPGFSITSFPLSHED